MSDLISRSESIEELEKYEKELQKDKVEAIETDDENMLFATTNQLTAICRIKRNIMNMPTAYDIDKVVEELETNKQNALEVEESIKEYNVWNDAIEIVKQGCVSDDVCEWKDKELYGYYTSCTEFRSRIACKDTYWKYCPYCGKKIKAVE